MVKQDALRNVLFASFFPRMTVKLDQNRKNLPYPETVYHHDQNSTRTVEVIL